MPVRIQMSRQRPWRAENPDAVIVSRPGQFGNPFRVGDWFTPGVNGPQPGLYVADRSERVRDRAHAVELFREFAHSRRDFRYAPFGARSLHDLLGGRDLACWCPLDQPCHADVLLEIANGDPS